MVRHFQVILLKKNKQINKNTGTIERGSLNLFVWVTASLSWNSTSNGTQKEILNALTYYENIPVKLPMNNENAIRHVLKLLEDRHCIVRRALSCNSCQIPSKEQTLYRRSATKSHNKGVAISAFKKWISLASCE